MKTALRTLLVLGLLLAPVPASARTPAAPGLAARAWSWLSSLGVKARCGIDPNGGPCGAPATTSTLDHGGCIDPDGACAPAAQPAATDAGGCIDPNGRLCPTSH